MSAYRDAVLREMGLAPIWRLRGAAGESAVEKEDEVSGAFTAPSSHEILQGDAAQAGQLPTAPIRAQPRRSQQVLPSHTPPAATVAEARPDPARAAHIAALDWAELEADMRACAACRLCERRKQAVPGVGDHQADWLFVGEGPGADEDARGEPFVGAAGRLLDNMLAAIGLKRGEDVYIANAVKCRPPHNRTPEADEVAACLPYLERQIALVRPKLIVTLGRPAAQALLEGEIRIGAARGKAFDFRGIPVVVTYHPAYLLRNQYDKAKAWEDLCFARRLMNGVRAKD